jgi:Transmembrane secretion effector
MGKASDIATGPGETFDQAAAGALVAIPLTWHWKLQTGTGVDLAPSMHWPVPIVAEEVEHDRGPVMVTVEYGIDPRDREPFLAALASLGYERRRDGAYAWEVFEDSAKPGRMVGNVLVDSWLEHLRQHERVTSALQDVVYKFHTRGAPKVTHLIAASISPRSCRTLQKF